MTLADRIVVLRAGKIEQVDTPLNLYNKPANLFVAGFIGAPNMNFISGEVIASGADGLRVKCLKDEIVLVPADPDAAKLGDTITIGVRPHHLTAADTGGITVSVDLVEALGAETVVHAHGPDGKKILAVLPGQRSLSRGDPVRLAFRPDQTHGFNRDGQRLAGN
jgi:multiple sugar transport system ATP-binding protein